MTMKIHKEFKEVATFSEYIPFRFGLMCFRIEPYDKVYTIKLYAISNGMQVDVN